MNHLALDDLMKPARPQPHTELKLATLEKHAGAMTGPVQKKLQLLKLLHRTEGRARAALCQKGAHFAAHARVPTVPTTVSGPAPQPDPPGPPK